MSRMFSSFKMSWLLIVVGCYWVLECVVIVGLYYYTCSYVERCGEVCRLWLLWCSGGGFFGDAVVVRLLLFEFGLHDGGLADTEFYLGIGLEGVLDALGLEESGVYASVG